MKTCTFTVNGMHCASCSLRVETCVNGLNSVKKATVNLSTSRMEVTFDESNITEKDIAKAVNALGFEAIFNTLDENFLKKKKEVKTMFNKFIISLIFALPLFYISMGHMMGLFIPKIISPEYYPMNFALIQLLLSIGSIIVGYKFYTIGFKNLFIGTPNMDSLVAVGTSAAFLYGIYIIFNDFSHASIHQLYFESVGVIITLILLGRYLENRSKLKTNDAIKKLMELTPKKATVIRNGKQTKIDILDVLIDDIVVISPGEKIAVDGIVIEGSSGVDESMLTGESISVEKQIDDKVYAGCINKYGYLKIKAESVGEKTLLSQIINMVEKASGSKPKIAHIADKIAMIFVPTVMTIAVVSALIWYIASKDFGFSMNIFISVLVIACPCALGLATPMAVIVAIGKGALSGILVKDSNSLEVLHKASSVVFDKTGTLTLGQPKVTDIITNNKYSEDEILKYAYSAENISEHPLGDAIVEMAELKNIKTYGVSEFAADVGFGINAIVNDNELIIGSEKILNKHNIKNSLKIEAETLIKQGKTLMFVAINKELVGIIAAMDKIRDDSKFVITEIKKLHKKTIILTGDNKYVAKAVCDELGADLEIHEVLPQEKSNMIKDLQSDENIVAMIGDGINDSVALAKADVGISVSSASQIAMEAADIVIMNDNLSGVLKAIKLSNITIKNIKQNLFFAFIYNIILIPIAAGVLYMWLGIKLNPMLASLAMSLSSVSVVLNALRIKAMKL